MSPAFLPFSLTPKPAENVAPFFDMSLLAVT